MATLSVLAGSASHATETDDSFASDIDDYAPGSQQPFGDEYERSVRPSLADKLVVGFMASDQFTQTDTSEIVDIKAITATAQKLEEDMAALRKNFDFNKQVMNAAFDQALKAKAFELYTRLNTRLNDVHMIHSERIDVIRRSFRQQLQDALVVMATKYKKFYEAKLAGKLEPSKPSKSKEKILALQQELSTAHSINQMLEVKIEQLKEELENQPTVTEIQIDTTEIDQLTTQNNSLTAELGMANDRIDELNDKIEFKDEKIRELAAALQEQESAVSKERQNSQKIAMQMEQLKNEMETFRADSARALDQQRFQMESDMASKLANSAEAAANAARAQDEMKKKMEAEFQTRLMEEKRKYEREMADLRAENDKANMEMEDTLKMQRIISEQKQQIAVYQQRLIRINAQWEKKFNILRASLHALKDESYVRMQLQKQAATLKYASISYGPDGGQRSATPPADPTRESNAFPPTKPLPSLPRKSSSGRIAALGKKTNTVPSGVGTEPFSDDDEEQDEEEMEGFVPLPPKPTFGNYMSSVA